MTMDMESLASKGEGDRDRRRWSAYYGEGFKVLALADGGKRAANRGALACAAEGCCVQGSEIT